ncbi:hypothetical protein E4U11_000952, partial [Claviceps purpurea]
LPAIRQGELGEARPPSAIDMLTHRRAVSTFSRNVTPEDLPVGGMKALRRPGLRESGLFIWLVLPSN